MIQNKNIFLTLLVAEISKFQNWELFCWQFVNTNETNPSWKLRYYDILRRKYDLEITWCQIHIFFFNSIRSWIEKRRRFWAHSTCFCQIDSPYGVCVGGVVNIYMYLFSYVQFGGWILFCLCVVVMLVALSPVVFNGVFTTIPHVAGILIRDQSCVTCKPRLMYFSPTQNGSSILVPNTGYPAWKLLSSEKIIVVKRGLVT